VCHAAQGTLDPETGAVTLLFEASFLSQVRGDSDETPYVYNHTACRESIVSTAWHSTGLPHTN